MVRWIQIVTVRGGVVIFEFEQRIADHHMTLPIMRALINALNDRYRNRMPRLSVFYMV